MQAFTKEAIPRPFPMNFDFHLGETEVGSGVISAKRCFGAEELVFEGHFPSNKILPGVMLVEYALYLGDRYLVHENNERTLHEVKSATFLSPVLPGDEVYCRCEFVEQADGLLMKAELRRDKTLCAKVRARYERVTG